MMRNFSRGGAAINVIARAVGASVDVIDVGVDADLLDLVGIRHAKVARGTRCIAFEPAMTEAEARAAIEVGREAVRRAVGDGVRVIALGEMGIANSTSAAAPVSTPRGSRESVRRCARHSHVT
jgi:nicotinate-nucleotide--dimethylbenzimidazole phosphoribosyltransferase